MFLIRSEILKEFVHLYFRILLRVRLLYIMRVEVVGTMEAAVRNECSARY